MKRVFILLFFVSISFNSFAQEPTETTRILLENIWNLSYLTLNGTIVDWSFNSEMGTVGAGFDYDGSTTYYFGTGACNGITTILSTIDDSSFLTTTFTKTSNQCNLPETIAFETAYFEGFFKKDDPEHTFTYTLDTTVPGFPDLLITNEDGDEAFYSGESMLSIEEANKTTLSIFPNPTKEKLTISSNNANLENISIFNIQGQEVLRVKFQQNEQTITVSSLQAGVYFLKAESDTGQQLVSKFVKQ